jgi:hypothetical protein
VYNQSQQREDQQTTIMNLAQQMLPNNGHTDGGTFYPYASIIHSQSLVRQGGITTSPNAKARKTRSHSFPGNTAAANGVAVDSILQQQQQRSRSWRGAPTVPSQNRQPMTIHQGPPPQKFNRHQARPVTLSSSQVQGRGQEFRNKNNPLGGRSDTSKNINSASAPGSRLSREHGRPGSTATSQAGNTRVQRMRLQRRASSGGEVHCPQATRMPSITDGLPMATNMMDARMQQSSQIMQSRRPQGGGGSVRTPSAPMQAPMQHGLSGRGAGGASLVRRHTIGMVGEQKQLVHGRRHSMGMAGGQQKMVPATPTIQQMASRGASFRAAQQSQMLSDSRPSSNTCNLQEQQMQGQGSSRQVGVARPVVRQYKRGSFEKGRAAVGVMDRQYAGQFAPQQRHLRQNFYESPQQGQGEHLSKLTLGSGGEGEYAAGYCHGVQQATNNSASPAIKKGKKSKSIASQIVQGLTGKSKSKPKKGVVGNSNNWLVRMQY